MLDKLRSSKTTRKPTAKLAAKANSKKLKPVQFRPGETDILVIAPHGINGVPDNEKDDKNTDILGFSIADELDCAALINDSIKRNLRNYNRRVGAESDKEFIKNLRSVLDSEGSTLVLWIHGFDEDKRPALEKQLKISGDGRLDCLVGYLLASFDDKSLIKLTRSKGLPFSSVITAPERLAISA